MLEWSFQVVSSRCKLVNWQLHKGCWELHLTSFKKREVPITENFDKSISGLIILSVTEDWDLRSNHQESSLNSWYLIHGCKHQKGHWRWAREPNLLKMSLQVKNSEWLFFHVTVQKWFQFSVQYMLIL